MEVGTEGKKRVVAIGGKAGRTTLRLRKGLKT